MLHTTFQSCIIIIYRFGCAKITMTDQGREFVNKVNRRLFKLTGTQHNISSAYHPQTNGLVERFNQTLQRSLVKMLGDDQSKWDDHLDAVLFAYRTATQKSTKTSPFEIMYCRYMFYVLHATCVHSSNVLADFLINPHAEKLSYQ